MDDLSRKKHLERLTSKTEMIQSTNDRTEFIVTKMKDMLARDASTRSQMRELDGRLHRIEQTQAEMVGLLRMVLSHRDSDGAMSGGQLSAKASIVPMVARRPSLSPAVMTTLAPPPLAQQQIQTSQQDRAAARRSLRPTLAALGKSAQAAQLGSSGHMDSLDQRSSTATPPTPIVTVTSDVRAFEPETRKSLEEKQQPPPSTRPPTNLSESVADEHEPAPATYHATGSSQHQVIKHQKMHQKLARKSTTILEAASETEYHTPQESPERVASTTAAAVDDRRRSGVFASYRDAKREQHEQFAEQPPDASPIQRSLSMPRSTLRLRIPHVHSMPSADEVQHELKQNILVPQSAAVDGADAPAFRPSSTHSTSITISNA